MKNRNANGMVFVLLLVVVVGVIGFVGVSFTKTTISSTPVPTAAVNKGDIDRSGAADESDRMMVQKQLGCEKTQSCWNATVGKTKDGDNPIYVFDLDLSGDGVINQEDIDLVK